jgi:predicted outer membrane protein
MTIHENETHTRVGQCGLRKRSLSLLLGVLLLAPMTAAMTGCGDDDDSNGGNTSVDRTGGTSGGVGYGGSGGSGTGGSRGTGGSGSGGSDTGGSGGSGTGGSGTGGSGGSGTGGSGGSGTGGSGTGGSADAGAGGGSGDAAAADTGGDAAATLSDAQVAGVVLELNSGEVTVGKLASTRADDDGVKSFAAKMVTEHGAAVTKLEMLFQTIAVMPTTSPERTMVAAAGMAAVTKLTPLDGSAFDKAYIDSQVEMHTTALTLLDTKLIPSASKTQLKTELTSMRADVAAHLMLAKQLQGSLVGDGGAGPDGR